MNIRSKLVFASWVILAILTLGFLRGQFVADSVEGCVGPFGYRVTNGWGKLLLGVSYPVDASANLYGMHTVLVVLYSSERIVNHSMFWLSDGNPFGVNVDLRGGGTLFAGGHGLRLEVDIGLLFLLAAAYPVYNYLNDRRLRCHRSRPALEGATGGNETNGMKGT
jgi:hypothetical protein